MPNSSYTPHYEQDVPYEVPEGWVWITLGEICTFLSRGKSPKYSEERKFPIFAQKCNLKEGGISLKQARFLDPSTIDKWDESYKLKTGDILINSTGTGTAGRTRLFDESFLGAYPFAVPDSHVSVVRTSTKIVSEYVYTYVSSLSTQLYLEENLAGSTNQKELYIGVIERLPLPLPPLAEQQRIVSEIEHWSVLIDTIEQGKENLETSIKQAKNKILDLAIHGKLVPQDPNDEPASELLKRINPKAEIACDNEHNRKLHSKGWVQCILNDVFTIIMGQSPDGNSINEKNGIEFHQGKLFFSQKKLLKSPFYTTSPIKIAKPNSLVLCVRAPVGDINTLDRKICIGRGLCNLQPNSALNLDFAYYSMIQHKVSLENKATGSTFKSVSKNIICKELFYLPPLAEQKRIVRKIKDLFILINLIEIELDK